MTEATIKKLLTRAFHIAVDAANPRVQMASVLPDAPSNGRLVVVGAGKAASAMVQAVEAHYDLDKLEGLVTTRYGHKLPTQTIEVIEAGHPVPDAAGESATQRILELVSSLTADDVLLCLISGGGSALLTAPAGLTLEQKAALTKDLLHSGADITEMNTVRKHLSKVKGGKLAQLAAPAQIYTYNLSDVVGDDLSSIASGATVPDPTTYADALAILDAYEITAPEARTHLQSGINGEIAETLKTDDALAGQVKNFLVGTNQQSLEAVKAFFYDEGIPAHILSSTIEGEAREVAKVHAAIAKQIISENQPLERPCVLLSGGETTVTVKHKGRGGRNSEFLLSLALELAQTPNVYALAADTDGIDGSEDNAGAFFLPSLFNIVSIREARASLNVNDAFSIFEAADALLVTGATNTNVNDLRILMIL